MARTRDDAPLWLFADQLGPHVWDTEEFAGREIVVHQPTSFAASDLVRRFRREGLVAEVRPTPTFALSKAGFDDWAGGRDTFRMEEFYRAQRERFDVLMEGTEPVGGRWNLDHDNRESPPYSSGGAYIDRMTDFCGGCAFDPKVRVGETACPFTAGYWQFVHRHRELHEANHRTKRAVATMDRLSDLDALLEQESAREHF